MMLQYLSEWERRIQRADALAQQYSFAREHLAFYREIVLEQRRIYYQLDTKITRDDLTWTTESRPLHDAWIDHHWPLLRQWFSGFLQRVATVGSPALQELAHALMSSPAEWWATLLRAYWTNTPLHDWEEQPALLFFPLAFLQPYAVFLVERYRERLDREDVWQVAQGGHARCPMCAHPPLLSVLQREGEGAKRQLMCVLCGSTWRYKRVCCPNCGSEDHTQLGYYRSEEFPHVRVEVCDACRTYLKGVDLTRYGLAVPVVDEIAAIPLDLWAMEQGYRKLTLNLIGI